MTLEQAEIDARLAGLTGWKREGEAIVRRFECGDFVGSVEFVDAIVAPAEALGHHPDIEVSWATVTVRITTHSAGGLTEADFDLAERIDQLG